MLQLMRFSAVILLILLACPVEAATLYIRAQETARFEVEVARSPEQQEKGLMFRKKLAADRGMLFLFSRPQMVSMWMKNTLIPLDMIFIAPGGYIARIEENAKPRSLAIISSGEPVSAVLELPGGTAKRIGARVGNSVVSEELP